MCPCSRFVSIVCPCLIFACHYHSHLDPMPILLELLVSHQPNTFCYGSFWFSPPADTIQLIMPLGYGASGGCLHGGASLMGEKSHFAAWKKGPENRKNEVELRPPLCHPLKHFMRSAECKFSPFFSAWNLAWNFLRATFSRVWVSESEHFT